MIFKNQLFWFTTLHLYKQLNYDTITIFVSLNTFSYLALSLESN